MAGLIDREGWRRRWLGSICRVQTERRVVSLTFDDGPAPATGEILSILKHYQIPAAFFVVGAFAEKDPATVTRILEEGHELGNHTMHHESFASLNWSETGRTLRECDLVLSGQTGQAPRWRRPCYGTHTPAYGAWNLLSGRTSFAWSRTGKDWLQPPAEEMLSSITNGLSSGEIVLLHDGTDRPEDTARSSRHETVRLLPMLIEHVQKIGFEWVSLSTVLRTGSPVYVYWPPEPPQPGQPPQRRRR